MQDDLFGSPTPPEAPTAPTAESAERPSRAQRSGLCSPAWDEALLRTAAQLPPTLRLGTSSWGYPGWEGIVWENAPSEQTLAKKGLPIYAQHPLLRTVSIDRSFYRPLTATQYLLYAGQVPQDFRFVVKAPSLVTDALVRSEDGRGREANPAFLNPELALQEFVAPALEGLGQRTGALVFQLSPLPWHLIDRLPDVLERLRAMLATQPALAPAAPDAVLAVEVRDPEWLAPQHLAHFADVLKSCGATYCLGLHPRLPPLAEQLRLLRMLWPGPLVCRWNLHAVHGPHGYADAEALYAPYDRIHHPDPAQHALLARTIAGITGRGQNAYVTISNHAEGCAPLTVRTLAEQVVEQTSALQAPAMHESAP
jgi:uncharacterized protein YecE (DUF72 family)